MSIRLCVRVPCPYIHSLLGLVPPSFFFAFPVSLTNTRIHLSLFTTSPSLCFLCFLSFPIQLNNQLFSLLYKVSISAMNGQMTLIAVASVCVRMNQIYVCTVTSTPHLAFLSSLFGVILFVTSHIPHQPCQSCQPPF